MTNSKIIKILSILILYFLFNLSSVFAFPNSLSDLESQKIQHNLEKDLFKGKKYPINPFKIDWTENSKSARRIDKNYPYLTKALSINNIYSTKNSKYFFIYDKSLEKKKFDLIKFEIPTGAKTLKITQVSDSFDTGDMTNELFFFPKNNSKNYIRASIKNLLNDAYAENGIIQISTNLDSLDYEYGMYVMSNYTQKKSYALLFEFLF